MLDVMEAWRRRLTAVLHRQQISLMEDDEFLKTLERLGLRERIERGEITCSSCGKVLAIQNVGGIVSASGEFKVICDSIECAGRPGTDEHA